MLRGLTPAMISSSCCCGLARSQGDQMWHSPRCRLLHRQSQLPSDSSLPQQGHIVGDQSCCSLLHTTTNRSPALHCTTREGVVVTWTGVGTRRGRLSPVPSLPCWLRPQARSWPVWSTQRACVVPHDTCVTCGTASGTHRVKAVAVPTVARGLGRQRFHDSRLLLRGLQLVELGILCSMRVSPACLAAKVGWESTYRGSTLGASG